MLWNIRTAVIDDEELQVNIIQATLRQIFAARKITSTMDVFLKAQSMLDAMEETVYDVYFIDINLINADGIDLAQKIREKQPEAVIVFISNQEERVYDSLSVQPVAFVRKSHFLQEIEPAVKKVTEVLEAKKGDSMVLVMTQGGIVRVDMDTCTYIESRGKKQLLHQNKTKTVVEIHSSMEILEKELSPRGFLRIQKGYLVNYRYIAYIANLNVTLTDGESLPASRDRNTEIKERFIELTKKNSIIF